MALLSKSELSERFMLPTKQLAVMIKRGIDNKKIMMDGDRIDDSNPLNKAWINKYTQKAIAKNGGQAPEKPKTQNSAGEESENEYANLELIKLKEQVRELQNKNKKLELGNEKVVGNFIQVEQVKQVIIHLSEAIHLAWENEIQERDNRLAARYQLSREQIAEIRADRNGTVNMSKQRAIKEAKRMLRLFQDQTSDKRGVGEHD